MTDQDEIVWVGERVRIYEGYYRFEGVVVTVFSTTKGESRLVLEADNGALFILHPDQVKKVNA